MLHVGSREVINTIEKVCSHLLLFLCPSLEYSQLLLPPRLVKISYCVFLPRRNRTQTVAICAVTVLLCSSLNIHLHPHETAQSNPSAMRNLSQLWVTAVHFRTLKNRCGPDLVTTRTVSWLQTWRLTALLTSSRRATSARFQLG